MLRKNGGFVVLRSEFLRQKRIGRGAGVKNLVWVSESAEELGANRANMKRIVFWRVEGN